MTVHPENILKSPTMSSDHWPVFACPAHNLPLEASLGKLTCQCGCEYGIRGDIPRFVPDGSYASAFGAQWIRYRETQLDSCTGVPVTERRLRRCLGPELWSQLRGALILEAGCGAGRFTEVLLKEGARVMSVDLTEAVVANQLNFPQGEYHRLIQADITKLPFREQQFDIVLCLGVLQHTPSPEQTIASLFSQVRPGGVVVIDHYSYQYMLSYYTKSSWVIRSVLKRLSADAGIRATEALVRWFLPLHRATRRSYLGQILLSRVSPVVSYYHALPELADEHQEQWALLDTHDSLTDWYKHFRLRGRIERCLRTIGATSIEARYGGNGVEARAARPAA